MKNRTKLLSEVELLIESVKTAGTSMNLNPMLTYIRFILTDNKVNANRVRIPTSEFSNLIRSGLYMPIKMTEGTIDSHEGSTPIGVITYLREAGDKIEGIAALWNVERAEDIQLIKDRYAEGKSLDISWEIGYVAEHVDESGVTILEDTILRAATLVGVPAYGGRTPITEVKSSTNTDDKEDETVTKEIEGLQARVKELETENAELTTKLETDKVQAELKELREYKSESEAALKRASALKEIKDKFASNGIERDESFFVANEAKLLALVENDALDFMLSQLEGEEEEGKEETEEEKKKRLEEENKEESDDEEEGDESEDEEEDSDDDDEEEEEEELKEETSEKKIPNMKPKKKSKKMKVSEIAEGLREDKQKK